MNKTKQTKILEELEKSGSAQAHELQKIIVECAGTTATPEQYSRILELLAKLGSIGFIIDMIEKGQTDEN